MKIIFKKIKKKKIKKVKNENPNKKLTDFQWEKLTKKEGKKGLNDFVYFLLIFSYFYNY